MSNDHTADGNGVGHSNGYIGHVVLAEHDRNYREFLTQSMEDEGLKVYPVETFDEADEKMRELEGKGVSFLTDYAYTGRKPHGIISSSRNYGFDWSVRLRKKYPTARFVCISGQSMGSIPYDHFNVFDYFAIKHSGLLEDHAFWDNLMKPHKRK